MKKESEGLPSKDIFQTRSFMRKKKKKINSVTEQKQNARRRKKT